jgi:hypothetical protein
VVNADGYFVDAIKYNGFEISFFGTREHVNIVRDLDALLNSLVNIDRDSLVAILTSEAEGAALCKSLERKLITRGSGLRRGQLGQFIRRLTFCCERHKK